MIKQISLPGRQNHIDLAKIVSASVSVTLGLVASTQPDFFISLLFINIFIITLESRLISNIFTFNIINTPHIYSKSTQDWIGSIMHILQLNYFELEHFWRSSPQAKLKRENSMCAIVKKTHT